MGEGCKDREGWSREGERWTTPGREERETRGAGGGDLARKKERETSGSPALLALRRLKARESARPRTRPGRDLLPSSFLHPVLSLSLSLSISLSLCLWASRRFLPSLHMASHHRSLPASPFSYRASILAMCLLFPRVQTIAS